MEDYNRDGCPSNRLEEIIGKLTLKAIHGPTGIRKFIKEQQVGLTDSSSNGSIDTNSNSNIRTNGSGPLTTTTCSIKFPCPIATMSNARRRRQRGLSSLKGGFLGGARHHA